MRMSRRSLAAPPVRLPSVIYIKITHALAFDRWVAKRGVVLADLRDAVTPLNGKPGRYRAEDKLLAFLQSL